MYLFGVKLQSEEFAERALGTLISICVLHYRLPGTGLETLIQLEFRSGKGDSVPYINFNLLFPVNKFSTGELG